MTWFAALSVSGALDDLVIKAIYLGLFYLIVKYTYRMFLSPIASFPGPRIAGITKLYEAYHVLLKNDWLENLVSLHEKYGPVVRIGPNELHFVDNKFNLDHHRRPDLFKCNNYYGLLNKLLGGLASPTKHAQRAAVMRPIFSGQTLAEYSKTLDKHIESLHSRLADAASDKGVINLTHYLWAYTNDVMISYLTEENYGFQKVYDLQATHDATRAFSAIDLATVLRCMPPVKTMFDYVPALRSFSPLGWLDNLISSHVRPMVKSWDDENSHQSVLARIFNEIGNETQTVHESSQAIFIGNESLLSNLTFVLHHLIQNPECIKKIRSELDTLDIGTYGHRIWRDPKTAQLRYLDAVCRESSRLSSPSWHRQPRQSDTPVEYQGAIIPPMTSMSFTLHLLERDATLFPDPNTFKPERWLGFNQESKTTKGHSVSFGTGTRTCLGQHFTSIAHRVLRKTVAFLIYNFNISLWDEKMDRVDGFRYLNTYPKKGHEGYMKVQMTPRFGSIA
ncbi:cytochrome P450 [Colletotrichum cuscutae]|uniref:Cytochrome P450 n=1 Tax=Colletotrichum cuscutae TaxID=1209917 RepID=A0AAI9UZS8_9PEZI|nr:cytochrome P450 [Colletotrichum cuscutae]